MKEMQHDHSTYFIAIDSIELDFLLKSHLYIDCHANTYWVANVHLSNLIIIINETNLLIYGQIA